MTFIHEIFGTSWLAGLFIIVSLMGIESILSIDNAVVLAMMVKKLPGEQKNKALHYGIWGAILMRGGCLLFVNWLTSMWVLKIAAGLWLLWLTYKHFSATEAEGEEEANPESKGIYKFFHRYLGVFWSTVILVEAMDMMFSTDNIFAAAAFTRYIGLIYIGVFIGIFAMRYVAQIFVKLIERYPFLEHMAYTVIGILGFKLLLAIPEHIYAGSTFATVMESQTADIAFAALTIGIFVAPILWTKFFGKDSGEPPIAPADIITLEKTSDAVDELTSKAEVLADKAQDLLDNGDPAKTEAVVIDLPIKEPTIYPPGPEVA